MKRMNMLKWDDEQVAILRQLFADGNSAATIGALLGCSKNAVIGKCHRIGLFSSGKEPVVRKPRGTNAGGIRQQIQAALRREREAAATTRDEAMKQQHFPLDDSTRKALNHFHPLPGKRTIGLMDLAPRSCRWPLDVENEHRYCGDPAVVGSPYCPYHSALAGRHYSR
jgi:GcrA cell cycle regulator